MQAMSARRIGRLSGLGTLPLPQYKYKIKSAYSGITVALEDEVICDGKYISVVDSTRITLK